MPLFAALALEKSFPCRAPTMTAVARRARTRSVANRETGSFLKPATETVSWRRLLANTRLEHLAAHSISGGGGGGLELDLVLARSRAADGDGRAQVSLKPVASITRPVRLPVGWLRALTMQKRFRPRQSISSRHRPKRAILRPSSWSWLVQIVSRSNFPTRARKSTLEEAPQRSDLKQSPAGSGPSESRVQRRG